MTTARQPPATSMLGYFRWALVVTVLGLALGAWLGWQMTGTVGGTASVFFICCVLAVLEISLSFDNAIVNANKIRKMTPRWRRRFLTWGILIALAGFVLSQAFTSVMGGILFLASLWAPAMVVPILAAILTRQRTHIPALCAQITGFGLSLSWSVLAAPGGIPPIVVGLTASAAAFLIASGISKSFQGILPDPIKNRGHR